MGIHLERTGVLGLTRVIAACFFASSAGLCGLPALCAPTDATDAAAADSGNQLRKSSSRQRSWPFRTRSSPGVSRSSTQRRCARQVSRISRTSWRSCRTSIGPATPRFPGTSRSAVSASCSSTRALPIRRSDFSSTTSISAASAWRPPCSTSIRSRCCTDRRARSTAPTRSAVSSTCAAPSPRTPSAVEWSLTPETTTSVLSVPW